MLWTVWRALITEKMNLFELTSSGDGRHISDPSEEGVFPTLAQLPSQKWGSIVLLPWNTPGCSDKFAMRQWDSSCLLLQLRASLRKKKKLRHFPHFFCPWTEPLMEIWAQHPAYASCLPKQSRKKTNFFSLGASIDGIRLIKS